METKNESNKDIGCCKRIERIPFIGYIAIIISAMFFAFLGVAVNILEKDIHPIQTLFVSYFLVGYLSFAFVIFADLSLKPFPGEAKYLIGRCIVGALTSFASYQSITILKLGDATAIIQSAPVYISIIAFIFLGEPCGVVLIVLIIMNFIGVLLIAKPSFIFSRSNNSTVSEQNGTEDSSSFGLVLANAAALGTAIHTILLRKLKETPISVTIFWTSIAVLLLAAAYLAFINQFKVPLIAKPYLFILIATVCILVAQGLQTLALRVEKAGPISLVRQVQVVFAFIDQVVILGDEVEFTSIVGAMIIVLTDCFSYGRIQGIVAAMRMKTVKMIAKEVFRRI
ncbi:solute carrier family 35 member G1-like protein [Leptotrombidium deliense]|uniref:Solute carrier family 35 member G1-like protein n=1 Tax=Leptotrombidium deliense TaxID=299467 RepID=A0A443SUF0_9ACAR|nr:solute carrier family 35 member G1-like protein [Leptotrombidium deliense]